MDLKRLIRDVPDFPKQGILFKDITTLLLEPKAFRHTILEMAKPYKNSGIQKICGVESRGFIFGSALAVELDAGFVPIRKVGKLPWKKISQEYALEYGTDQVEIHADAVSPGEKILIVDDLLATGGTVGACVKLLQKMEAKIQACVFLIELDFLNGRAQLEEQKIHSLIQY